MPRTLIWLFIAIVAVLALGSIALLFIDVPHTPQRVELPVANETLGI